MAEEDAEHPVRRDRVGLRHGHHAGQEDLVGLARLGAFGEDMRRRRDDVDAVDLGRARLHALLAEELRGDPYIVDRIAGLYLSDDLAIAGERDLLPEFAHHLGRRPQADGRADLRRIAAIAGGELHDDDVALAELALGGPRIAEEHRRIRHRGRADDQKVDIAAALQHGGAGGAAQIGLGRARPGGRHHRRHGALAQHAGLAHAIELLGALDDDQLVDEAAGEHDLGLGQAGPQVVILIDRHVILVARIDLDQADASAREADLLEALHHHLGVTSAAALPHVRQRGRDLAADRLGVGAAHREDQRRRLIERDQHVGRQRVPLPVAGEPGHAAAETPMARPARHDHGIELVLAHLVAQRRITAGVFFLRELLPHRVAIQRRVVHVGERSVLVEAGTDLLPGNGAGGQRDIDVHEVILGSGSSE